MPLLISGQLYQRQLSLCMLLMALAPAPVENAQRFPAEAEGGGFLVGRGAEPRCPSGNPRPSRGRRRGGLGGIRPLWIPLRLASWPSLPRPGSSVL